jgi:hypothetical protein
MSARSRRVIRFLHLTQLRTRGVAILTSLVALWSLPWQPAPALATDRAPILPEYASTASGGNFKGFSVAISGGIAVAGVPGVNGWTGMAYIYVRSGRLWIHSATLTDPRHATDDVYAWSVAASNTSAGNYVVVGGNDGNDKRDYVYVYKGSGRSWHLQATIGDPGTTSQDMFGDSVAISGTTLVIGASCQDGLSGHAYVYTRVGQRWIIQASLADPAGKPNQDFGQSVAVSGRTAIIGSRDTAYVYRYTYGHGWAQAAKLRNPGNAEDAFGQSVSTSGTTAVIGAPGPMPPEYNVTPGAAYAYALSGGKWSLRQKLANPQGAEEFGFSVAISGNRTLIGMPLYGKDGCGGAYEYTSSRGKWIKRDHLYDSGCPSGAQFGWSVAISGHSGCIGAPFTESNEGAAFVTDSLP